MRVSSPQGRFADGAALLDGRVLRRTEAYGKHLLHYYRDAPALHVHLGLYGKFTTGTGEPPEPVGALRLRLVAGDAWTDLRGPTACELSAGRGGRPVRPAGPGPAAPRRRPGPGLAADPAQPTSIAALLMDQAVIAGIGNVYRAELLFRHRVDPFLPGRSLPAGGVAGDVDGSGRADAARRAGRPDRDACGRPTGCASGGRLARTRPRYVYRRAGLPCRVCGTEVRTESAGRAQPVLVPVLPGAGLHRRLSAPESAGR